MRTGEGFLDVWTVDLKTADADPGILSKDELTRLGSMPPARAGEFARSRTALRTLLGTYTGISARDMVFAYGTHGKPSLKAEKATPSVHFNMAHSGDLALIAVTDAGAVGVDVERIRAMENILGLARDTFGRDMVAFLEPLKEEQRVRALLTRWVRSEAVVKRDGGDMARDYNRTAMPLSPDTSAKGVIDLDVGSAYVAALSLGNSADMVPEIKSFAAAS